MSVKVRELLEIKNLDLRCVTGERNLDSEITEPLAQKPGLLLTGRIEDLHSGRVQVFGAAEVGYIDGIDEAGLGTFIAVLSKPEIPVIVVTRSLTPPKRLVGFAEGRGIPVLVTGLTSSVFIERLVKFLEESLAPSKLLHGVLVDVLGIGILITGKSGIGKSECALALISGGHRLVADDAVIIKRMYPSLLVGEGSDKLPYHIEVRGIGIVNVKDLFGITAIREKKQLDLAVELVAWDPKDEYERLGFEQKTIDILGVAIPYLKIPVRPGRNMATIVEVAARNQILKITGQHPGKKAFEGLIAPSPASAGKAAKD